MADPAPPALLERIFREEQGRVAATLIRQFGDIDVADHAIHRQDDGQGHDDLGRGQGDDEQGEHLATHQRRGVLSAEGDQEDVRRAEEQLDPDEDQDGVAPGQDAIRSEPGEDGGEQDGGAQVHHRDSSPTAAVAPTIFETVKAPIMFWPGILPLLTVVTSSAAFIWSTAHSGPNSSTCAG